MQTVIITGGTGLIGTALTPMLLNKGYKVIILTRGTAPASTNPQLSYAQWNVNAGTIDANAVAGADYIIHLAGAGVAEKRWSDARKKEILNSRTQSGTLLVKALTEIPNQVQGVISSSAIGWYGADDGAISTIKPFTETEPAATDFLGDTCQQWEESIEPVTKLGKRLAIIRTGIVLSNAGGALAEFKKPLQFGTAAILGGGTQVISWIHIEDICRMYLYALENNLQGIYNGVAPAPVSNKLLTLCLAKAMRGNYYIPLHVPAFALKLVLGEMSVEVLKSATVSATKIKQAGFQFLYPSIEAAVTNLTAKII
ncbi:TIGR01777 family oxidoreductase [Limnovirga soli]|uniref:TIGR01777 family protein n=1 Tax=Limnovirga soli TaxID=2656915 RepID=A0A8J8FLI9_9BACT|nr:TIGR01777 family oxidoreductase [Limnovirga soli]NNV57024.1 TIGR01777 family protein [Limnovirga soli]